MSALRSLVIEPMRFKSPALGWFRFWQMFGTRTNGYFDEAYIRASRAWRPKRRLAPTAGFSAGECANVVSELRTDGFSLLPSALTTEQIDELKKFAFSTPAYGKSLEDMRALRPDALPRDVGRFTWRMSDVIGQPIVQELVLSGPYCQIAQDYLGCRPTLTSILLWLNTPAKGIDANRYHYDNDGPGFLKFFFLLTDMDIGTGAHYFVKGSHGKVKPRSVSAPALYDEAQVFSQFDRAREHIAGGPVGTIFAEDTRGFHRGSDIQSGYRLLLQLQFSAIDIPTDEDLKQYTKAVTVPNLDPALAAITRKFYR